MTHRLILSLLVAVAVLGGSLSLARAAQPAAAVEASMVAKQAIDYYQNGQYALAAELYRRAFRIDSTKPDYLFGVGRSEQKAGHVKEARLAFEMLRGILPSTDPLFKKCQQAIDDLEKLAQPRPEPPADKPPVVVAPTPVPVLAPTTPPPTAPQPPPPGRATDVAPSALPPTLTAPTVRAPTVTAPTTPEPMNTRLVGWVLIAGGGALGITGAAVALSTLSDGAAWNRDSSTVGPDGRITGTDYQTAASTVSSLNTRIGIGVGVGVGGLAAAGIGTWLLLHEPAKVSLLPTGQGLVVGGRF